jgi:hypothetical protein
LSSPASAKSRALMMEKYKLYKIEVLDDRKYKSKGYMLANEMYVIAAMPYGRSTQ